MGFTYSAVALGVSYFFGREMIAIFIESDDFAVKTQVLEQGYICLVITVAFYALLTLVNTVRFTIQGMGFSGFAVFAGVAEMFARALVGIFLIPAFGFVGACFASPVAWIFADVFLIPAYRSCYNRLFRLVHRT